MEAVEPACILGNRTAPRHGQRQEQGVQTRVVEALADVLAGGQNHPALTCRDGQQLFGHRVPLLLGHPRTQRHDVRDPAGDQRLEPIEMLVPFREHERRPPGVDGFDHVVTDAFVAPVIFDQFPIQVLELDSLVGVGTPVRHEGGRLHEDVVPERVGGRLDLRVRLITNRPALHEDDGVVTVLARHGGRQPRDEAGLRLARHLLEALR